mmetsp:Transcript_16663/g.24408  ORF Transcript_16663/g.24408 Transcript_16663/m.24408 type:complete len:82 (-) Transcript_16663:71-316(-)|eukprot:CAMPEP_0194093194 /NCGR_PEP_ID=MMETSP0149-20130528/49576_1 /TAXON_ID=122233 /ORGANISM="Chaetoceros debilis, Strain MM31A-1" /LENGTH=81 /DNA_ID=CAMNT_0038778419 /DNA_START=431 /DNA_END=676 /DNA_ORIENTATION=-
MPEDSSMSGTRTTDGVIENGEGKYRLRLRAFRCDIDGDAVVKVSRSEKQVIRKLKEAIRILNKMRTSKFLYNGKIVDLQES